MPVERCSGAGAVGFGVLPALTGLPTSISCQRCSKMVARAASRCTGKRGSLAEDGAEEEGRRRWEEAMQRRARREGGQNQQQPLLLLLCFSVSFCQLSFSGVLVIACTENGEDKIRGQEGKFLRT